MIALCDSGNSRLHFSWWDGEKVINAKIIPYPVSKDSLMDTVHNFFEGVIPHKVAACSVSSYWRDILFKALDTYAQGRLVVVRNAYDVGIRVRYDKPETIGVDRVLAAYAAYHFFQDSCVVVDAGTAVTVDAVDQDGTFIGGYIFPGFDVLSWALSAKTSLPDVSMATACEGIGNSTETCISFGLSMGFSGAVSRLVNRAAAIVDGSRRIVVTGGGALSVLSGIPFPTKHKPYLVLEGLGYTADTLPAYSGDNAG